MRARTPHGLCLLALVVTSSGCGGDLLFARFTSQVVQQESCVQRGDAPEVCTAEAETLQLQLTVVEVDDQQLWLYGIPQDGVPERSILGTRDSGGGFLFVDESAQLTDTTGCALVARCELALRIDPAADASAVGTDACIALIGRETLTTTSSAGCDTATPPAASVRTNRRRWQQPVDCAP